MSFRIRMKNDKEKNINTNETIESKKNIDTSNEIQKETKLNYDTIIYDKKLEKWRIIKQGTIINS